MNEFPPSAAAGETAGDSQAAGIARFQAAGIARFQAAGIARFQAAGIARFQAAGIARFQAAGIARFQAAGIARFQAAGRGGASMARDIPRRLDEGSVPGDIVEFERRGYTARGSLHSGARMGA